MTDWMHPGWQHTGFRPEPRACKACGATYRPPSRRAAAQQIYCTDPACRSERARQATRLAREREDDAARARRKAQQSAYAKERREQRAEERRKAKREQQEPDGIAKAQMVETRRVFREARGLR